MRAYTTENRRDGGRRRRAGRVFAAAVCLILAYSGRPSRSVPVDGSSAKEFQIKAAYLYKFLLFVKWPPSARETPNRTRIAILGDSPLTTRFGEVAGKPVGPGDSVLIVRQFDSAEKLLAAKGVRHQLVFVAFRDAEKVAEVLSALRGKGNVTVADHEGFLEGGGMINLLVHRNTVRWEINRKAVAEEGLGLDAQLLRNALRVLDKE